MPQPKAENRFPEIMELLNRAVESERGIAVTYPSGSRAWAARMRMYAKINDARKQSYKIFEPDHPFFGKTIFDSLEIRLEPHYQKGDPERETKIIIKKLEDGYYQLNNIQIEEL